MKSKYSDDFTCAQLEAILHCSLQSGETEDVVVVRTFKKSKWKPKTTFKGCYVLEEETQPRFVLAKYLTRGAHIVPVFDTQCGRFILNDLIDFDMFLHAGN